MTKKSTAKGVLCALGLILLGTVSVSAVAQSNEYRRGYDQGYNDGIETQSQQDQENRPAGRIIIDEASYGRRDATCNARDAMQNTVGRRRNITFTADNGLCGDPAPGRPKRLDVVYRCGEGRPVRAQANEGTSLTMNCR